MTKHDALETLNRRIISCSLCPRLVKHRNAVAKNPPLRYRGQHYWARPLPGFGDPHACVYVIGLAPAANGGNRTGRIFTGDRSGDWLFGTLNAVGLANQGVSISKNDGLKLNHTYIGAAVRCAPPDNKPTMEEFRNCKPYLVDEFELLKQVRVIVVLGSLAYNAIKKVLKEEGRLNFQFPPFAHGRKVSLPDGRVLICSYHPSQQNTFTKRLTQEMFLKIFEEAKQLCHL
jgi:uracil-DNA glycosylase family 4